MNPGLVIMLRPAGPWRIGPDSGARNKVDVIYHSDSLYSAVTGAMARLGGLEEWLDATARAAVPGVCFSSCFPFLDEIRFVVPPRTLWPPMSPSLMSAAVRWKSARFVPLEVVQAMLAGQALDKDQWSVDGGSACLVPVGRPGPFRTVVRWSAAVDRLSGASERHGVACIEFRAGAGLWTVASFADEAARDRWTEPVKAAFRLLADSGFGGERSRGWGRAESPEFVAGRLPELIVGQVSEMGVGGQGSGAEVGVGGRGSGVGEAEPAVVAQVPEPGAGEESAVEAQATEPVVEPLTEPEAQPESEAPTPDPRPLTPVEAPTPDPQPLTPVEAPAEPLTPGLQAHWLLSLFTPAATDTVDWARGNYVVLARGGRVESPAGSGDLKKQARMVAEGSVVYAERVPCGAAADVAPDGFAHPVFRAGFALSVPLPEVR